MRAQCCQKVAIKRATFFVNCSFIFARVAHFILYLDFILLWIVCEDWIYLQVWNWNYIYIFLDLEHFKILSTRIIQRLFIQDFNCWKRFKKLKIFYIFLTNIFILVTNNSLITRKTLFISFWVLIDVNYLHKSNKKSSNE